VRHTPDPVGRSTAVPTLEEAPFVDFFDPEVVANPEPVMVDLRRRTAVVRMPLGASVIRREAVRQLLADPRLISSIPALVRIQGVDDGPLLDMVSSSVIAIDGADHTRLRRLVSRSFTPTAAARHRSAMRALVNELVDGFVGHGRCEFVTEFADHYPVQVICEVLGVPREDHDDFAHWGDSLTYVLSLELGPHLDEVERAVDNLRSYVEALIADRQANPRDDLVTSLVEASEDGDRLSSPELFSMIGGILFAGYDTTRNQLGMAMAKFCEHPDQWKLLAEQPDLAPQAVDEVMRLVGAVGGVPRFAMEDVEVDGWVIPAGTIVFLSVASANRDETVFDDSLEFDITAQRESQLTFGGGPHYCLGVHLARAEMEEALRILPKRLPNLRLDGEAVWRVGTGIAGPSRLPLAFG
jgi:cytochrome P450